MMSWIFKRLGIRAPTGEELVGRLDTDEVVQIARSYTASARETEEWQRATLVERGDGKIWVVSEYVAMGSVAFVEIDDETGAVLKKGRHGLR